MLTNIKWCHVTEKALYCAVNSVFLRNINSDERFIETPPKEVLYLDVNIFCCKTSTFLAKKSLKLFLSKHNRLRCYGSSQEPDADQGEFES